jgi:hypothetical protein
MKNVEEKGELGTRESRRKEGKEECPRRGRYT